MSERHRRGRLPAWKKLAFAALATAIFFAVLELGLWLAGVEPVRYADDPHVGFSATEPLFVEETAEDGSVVMATARNKIRFFNAQRFPRQKPDGVFRIFCLGGSTTYGRPYDDTTSFCGWLRELLPVADPSRRWEVINAGGISYASYRIAVLAEELAAYQPDLFIVYSGHNEFLERRTYSGLIEMPRAVRGLSSLASRSRTFTVVRSLVAPRRERVGDERRELLAGEVEAILDNTVGPASYERDDAWREQVLAHFGFNVARIVDIARAAGSRVLLVAPASNLGDCSPFKSVYRDDLDGGTRRRLDALLGEARESLGESGDAAAALQAADAVLAVDPRHAGASYLRGRALEALGRAREALEAYRRARDEDVCPLRAPSEARTIVETIARDRRVPLVDFAEIVASRSRDGIADDTLFLDHVHPTIEGNRVLGVALVDELARLGIVRTAPGWDDAAIARVAARVETGLDRNAHAIALKNLSKVLGWAGKFDEARTVGMRATEQLEDDAEAIFHLGVAHRRLGDLDSADRCFRRCLELEPGYVEARKSLGRIAEERGDVETAAGHFEAAIRQRPDYAEAISALGNIRLRQGQLDAAADLLERAARIEPENAEMRERLGAVAIRRRDFTAARAHLQEAVRLDAALARAHHNLGLVELELGDVDAALRSYREALRIDPEYASAHESLGNIHANAGEIERAVDHFGEVIRIDPAHAEVRRKLGVMAKRFRGVVGQGPRGAEAIFYLGLIAGALGDGDQARALLEGALARARAGAVDELAARIESRLRRLREPTP